MSYGDDLPEGPRILGHAIGHACAAYGDRVDDYADLLAAALHGRHRAPATAAATHSDYVTGQARQLIAQAEGHQLDNAPGSMSAWEWIGAATEIMRELTRDA